MMREKYITKSLFFLKKSASHAVIGTLLFVTTLGAAPISLEESKNVAINWMVQETGKSFQLDTSMQSTQAKTQVSVLESSAYRIIRLKPQGWVIVSSDDIAKPIIGYGESPINNASLPPAFVDWMRGVEVQINAGINAGNKSLVKLERIAMQSSIASEWDTLKVDTEEFKSSMEMQNISYTSASSVVVSPLLWLNGTTEDSGILWDQGQYYNNLAPNDANGPNGHAHVGCVATAMAQIMVYHGAPTTGTRSHSYNCSQEHGCQENYGPLGANFAATTYDWTNMPNALNPSSTDTQVNAVATLSYHAGVAVDMMYGSDGSGAYPEHVAPAMIKYFGYSANRQQKASYVGDWNTLLKTSLDDRRPIFYGGTDGDASGHAFVMDGYDRAGDYHFNWGWGGCLNGWFALESLTPELPGYTYNHDQVAVFMTPLVSGGGESGGGESGGGESGGGAMGYLFPLFALLMLFRRKES